MRKEINAKFWKFLNDYFWRFRFVIATVLFLLWIFFIDSSSVLKKRKLRAKIKDLEEKKEFYIEKIKSDSLELEELKRNKNNIERLARENYYMKKENEEIFVIQEEK